MEAHEVDEIPPGDPFLVLLFQLPKEMQKQAAVQARFFTDKSFWQPHLARMFLWAKPLGVSKTETPDGKPALALLVTFTDERDILFRVGQDIAEELEMPAFAVTLTFLEEQEQKELSEAPSPW